MYRFLISDIGVPEFCLFFALIFHFQYQTREPVLMSTELLFYKTCGDQFFFQILPYNLEQVYWERVEERSRQV